MNIDRWTSLYVYILISTFFYDIHLHSPTGVCILRFSFLSYEAKASKLKYGHLKLFSDQIPILIWFCDYHPVTIENWFQILISVLL